MQRSATSQAFAFGPSVFPFVNFFVHSSLLETTLCFLNPNHLLMLQIHLIFRLFFFFPAQLSQQTSSHLLLNVSDTGVQAASCRLMPGGFPVETDVIQNFSSVFKGYNFLHSLEGNQTHCVQEIGLMLHRFSRPLGNYEVVIPNSVFLHLISHNHDLSDLTIGFSSFE